VAGEKEPTGLPGDYPYAGSVRMSADLRADLVRLCSAGLPNEACGVAGGRPGEIVRLYPLTNVSASHERYTVDVDEQMDAYRAMADDDLECVAVFHSHPATPARPSRTDIAEAYDPDALYVIVSFAAEAPSVRAFTIRDGSVSETTIETEAPA
jgi:proteasome lid subunit RPN8/RPN11